MQKGGHHEFVCNFINYYFQRPLLQNENSFESFACISFGLKMALEWSVAKSFSPLEKCPFAKRMMQNAAICTPISLLRLLWQQPTFLALMSFSSCLLRRTLLYRAVETRLRVSMWYSEMWHYSPLASTAARLQQILRFTHNWPGNIWQSWVSTDSKKWLQKQGFMKMFDCICSKTCEPSGDCGGVQRWHRPSQQGWRHPQNEVLCQFNISIRKCHLVRQWENGERHFSFAQ